MAGIVQQSRMTDKPQLPVGLKLALDLGPLVLFFIATTRPALFEPLVAPFLSAELLAGPHAGIFTATIIYVLFGSVLLGGLAFGKPLLGVVFDSVFNLTEEGWRKLTLRWALFFFVLAVLNEVVWRTQSDSFWALFKLVGVIPLTFVFAALQYPLLTKYAVTEPAEAKEQ